MRAQERKAKVHAGGQPREAGKRWQEHRSGRGKGRKRHTQKHAPKRRTQRGSTPQKPASRPLTPRQERLARELATAPSIAAAGRAAGYSESTVRSPSWYRRVHEIIRPVTLAHLARAGLTLPKVARRYNELADAEKVVAVQIVGGKDREQGNRELVTVPDHGIRLEACRDYMRILGPLGRVAGDMPPEGEMDKKVTLIINHPKAPTRVQAEPLRIRVPGREDGKDGR